MWYNHSLIRFDTDRDDLICPDDSVSIIPIDMSNVSKCWGGGTSLSVFRKYLNSNEDIRGLLFINKETKEPIGYCWIFLTVHINWNIQFVGTENVL